MSPPFFSCSLPDGKGTPSSFCLFLFFTCVTCLLLIQTELNRKSPLTSTYIFANVCGNRTQVVKVLQHDNSAHTAGLEITFPLKIENLKNIVTRFTSSFRKQRHIKIHTCSESDLFSVLELSFSGFTILSSTGQSTADYNATKRNTSRA